MSLDAVLARIDETLPAATERLFELLRIPSISTDPAYKADCATAADWLVADLRGLGFDASARAHAGPPDGRRPVRRRRGAICCSTATTTCSRSIRLTSGTAIRSTRRSRTRPRAR